MLLEVTSCLQVKATMEPQQADALAASIRSKFIISESTRPDAIQLFSGLNDMFNLQGKKYSEHISNYISEFNGSSKVDSARLSEAEQKMLLLLPSQQPEFLNTIEKHWNNFKGQDSGITLKMLLSQVDRQKRLESGCPGVWQQIFVASAEKNTLYVRRCVDMFLKNLAEAQSTCKKGSQINLR